MSAAIGAALACAALAAPAAAGAQTFSTFGAGIVADPRGVAVDQKGFVYVADAGNSRIRKFSNTGALVATFGTTGSGDGELLSPVGVAVDHPANQADDPNIYFADSGNHHVQKLDPEGSFLLDFGAFNDPVGVEVDVAGHVWVTDAGDDIVVKFAPNGTLLNVYGRPGGGPGSAPGEFDEPLDVDSDPSGDTLVADAGNDRAQKLDPLGAPVWQAGGIVGASGIDHDVELTGGDALVDRIWAVARGADSFVKLDESGNLLETHGAQGNGPGEFNGPYGIAVDCDDNVFVSDSGNDRVQRFGTTDEPPCTPPLNERSPELAGGTVVPGSGLALDPGEWSGSPTPRIAQRWQRCATAIASSCGDIPGERGLAYTVTEADRGLRLRALVVAANVDGVVSEPTDMTPLVPIVPIDPLPPTPPNPPPTPTLPIAKPPTVTRIGLARFRVGCPATGRLTCAVRADLVGPGRVARGAAVRRGFVVLARTGGPVRFDQSRSYWLRLTPAARRLLGNGYNRRAVLRVFVDGKRRLTAPARLNQGSARRFAR